MVERHRRSQYIGMRNAGNYLVYTGGVRIFKTDMPGDFLLPSLENTTLLRRLEKPFQNEAHTKLAQSLAKTLPAICRLAVDRMRLMPVLHPEFTLHDDTHLLRVTELMSLVLPEKVLQEVLNPVEI